MSNIQHELLNTTKHFPSTHEVPGAVLGLSPKQIRQTMLLWWSLWFFSGGDNTVQRISGTQLPHFTDEERFGQNMAC